MVISYRDIFSREPLFWSLISKVPTFLGKLWVLSTDSLYKKVILGIFVISLFPKLEPQKKSAFTISAAKEQHILFLNKTFLREMVVSFCNSYIPLYIEKNPVEQLFKVVEMKLKTNTEVSFFWEIKFKIFHHVEHNFIGQSLGYSKNQTSFFKYQQHFQYLILCIRFF